MGSPTCRRSRCATQAASVGRSCARPSSAARRWPSATRASPRLRQARSPALPADMARSRQRLLVGRAAPEPPPEDAEDARYEAAWTAYLDVARERVVISAPALARLVATRLGLAPADPAAVEFVEHVESDLLEDPSGPLAMLAPDIVVYAPALTDGIVLTHRLTADELAAEHL